MGVPPRILLPKVSGLPEVLRRTRPKSLYEYTFMDQPQITLTLLAGQSLFSAAMIVSFTVASIIAVELSGSTRWTGVPSTLMVMGAAIMAFPLAG
jgi:hypothetical protein